ncbi:hypothetical protein BDR03DRAFT_975680 [Suillus americanus]|nr:hypothetical protein BDR03DRAFT_975680 [Suillus americanus]
MQGCEKTREERVDEYLRRRNYEWNRKIQAHVFRARKTREYRLHIQNGQQVRTPKFLQQKKERTWSNEKRLTHCSPTRRLLHLAIYHTSSTLPRAPECD